MMKRLTRKALLNEAKRLDAIKIVGNVYHFEIAEYDIMMNKRNDNTEKALEQVKQLYTSAVACFARDIVYSAGTYGCNGKIAQLIAVDEAKNWLGIAGYIYF